MNPPATDTEPAKNGSRALTANSRERRVAPVPPDGAVFAIIYGDVRRRMTGSGGGPTPHRKPPDRRDRPDAPKVNRERTERIPRLVPVRGERHVFRRPR